MRTAVPILFLTIAALATTAEARSEARSREPLTSLGLLTRDAEVALNFGTFGALDTEQLFEVGIEYRLGGAELADGVQLRPVIGYSHLADGGNYTYLGGRMEIDLGGERDWELGLSFAPGIYSAGAVELGGPLEFRSGIDLGAAVADDVRASVGLFHLSNGGLYSINGGAESVLVSVGLGL